MSADRAAWPWSVLGIDGPSDDPRAVRRAYARLLKERDWSSDAAGFERLRAAYEAALAQAGQGREPRRSVVAELRGGFTGAPPATDQDNEAWQRPQTADKGDGSPGSASDTAPNEPPADLPLDPIPAENDPAQSRTEPQPKPSIWGASDPDALVDRVLKLLKDNNFSLAAWQPVFASKHMQDPWFRQGIEGDILAHLDDMLRNNSSAGLPAAWLNLADDHFRWRTDGIAFVRRFPYYDDLMVHILGALKQTDTPKPEAPRQSLFAKWWLYMAASLIGYVGLVGYYFGLERVEIIGQAALAVIAGTILTGFVKIIGALIRVAFRMISRTSQHLDEAGTRLALWWSRPLGSFRKTSVTLFLIGMLPIFISYESISNSGTRGPRLNESAVMLKAAGVESNFGHPRTLLALLATADTLERYPRLYGYEAESRPPMQLQDQVIFNMTPPQQRMRPLAMLSCRYPEERSCELSVRIPMNVTRRLASDLVPSSDPSDRGAVLSNATLQLRLSAIGMLEAARSIDASPYIVNLRDEAANDSTVYNLRTDLFAPVIEVGGQDYQISRSRVSVEMPADRLNRGLALHVGENRIPVELPADSLHQPITMRFDWPDPVGSTMECSFISDTPSPQHNATCNALRDSLRPGPEMICQGYRSDCKAVEGPLRTTFGTPETVMLFQNLLHRAATPGPHPPLEGAEAVRDAVAADYALILDRPGTGGRIRDRDTLLDALSRQPQLFTAARALPEEKDEFWHEFVDQMRDLGFDMPEDA